MNSNENNFNEQMNEDGQMGQKKDSFGSKVSSFAHNVKDFRDNGGIKGIASDYITSKKNQAKDNIKGKINDKIPESVKQKQKQLQNLKEKADPRKKLDNVKSDLNEKVFRRGVKSAVDAVAPGAGIAAEKMLDVGEGKKAVEAARAADTPTQGLKAGTKELVKIVVTKETKKKILISIIPTLVCFFLVLLIVMTVVNKFNDSKSYAQGGLGGEAFSKIDEKYKAFYENVDKYANGADKLMIVAVLTSYAKNDDYIDMEAEDDNDDGEGNVEISEEINGVTTLSKSKMKKYIKKVAKKINESGSIEKGDYNDSTTGSEFFWWLYEDFVIDYYSNYVTEGNTKKRQEIVNFIYLYYEELKRDYEKMYCINSYINTSCPQVTVTGKSAGVYSLEEYVAAVVAQELGYSGFPQAIRAQAIAARTYLFYTTNNCSKSIENSTNAQTLNFSRVTDEIREAVNDTAGLILTKDGKVILSQYSNFAKDHSCSGTVCTGTFLRQPSYTSSKITIDVAQLGIGLSTGSLKGGHQWGMSQYGALYFDKVKGYSYEQILKHFYDDDVKISATSDSNGNNADYNVSGEEVRLTVYSSNELGVSVDNSRISSNSQGWKFYKDDDGKNYLVVATATEECLDDDACAGSESKHSSIKYYNYYDKILLSIKGVEYDAIVLGSCSACMQEKSDRGDNTNNRIDIWVDASAASNNTHGIGDYDGIVYDTRTSNNGGICGSNGNGLVTVDGFVQRVSRPKVDNSYYYVQNKPSNGNSWGAAGTLEGECSWYATGRAKEILATLNNGGSWTYNGNGDKYCSASEASNFEIVKDSTKPKPGAIVSWSSGSYGHVAIVESVNGNQVTISEAGLGFGPTTKYLCGSGECIRNKLRNGLLTRHQYCEADGSGCFNTRTVDLNRMATLSGTFNCYVYLTDPK